MKCIFVCTTLLILSFSVAAQIPGGFGAAKKAVLTGRVFATVKDSITNKAVNYATVSLIDTKSAKPVNGGVTDQDGRITLQNVAAGSYNLKIGFIGYVTKSISIETSNRSLDKSLGTLLLSPVSNALSDVKIEGKKAIVENKIDRMVYNAEADGTNAGGDATDVMRKVPTLSVDPSGNVQLRGASVKVLIDGKPSGTMAASTADALKMIPAEQIKSVEVITSPSAKYDAEGSGGIVNIITKKSNAQGLSGNVSASAGTRQNNGSLNLTARSGRLSVNGNLASNVAYAQDSRVDVINNTLFTDGSTNNIAQKGITKWNRGSYNGGLGVDYDVNAYNNISSTAKFTRFTNGGPGTADYIINTLPAINSSQIDLTKNNIDWNVDYIRTFKKEGEEFSLSGQLSTSTSPTTISNILTSAAFPKGFETNSKNNVKNNEYTGQTDYTYPFNKTTILELGAKGIFRSVNSKYGNDNGNFAYSQDVAAAYSVISFDLTKRLKFKGGLRAEYTNIGFNTLTNGTEKNNYFNLFPSFIVSRTLNKGATLKFSYNRRVERPTQAYLNPFRNESDRFNVSQGNPQLDPELSQNFEIGYNTFIKGSIITASIFYRNTGGVIEKSISPLVENGLSKVLATYINVGRSQSYGLNLFGSYNPMPKWTLMSNLALNSYEVTNTATNISTGTFLNYSLFGRSAYGFGKGFNFELFGVATSATRTYQGKTDPLYFYGASLKKDILKKKGSIGVNTLNPFTKDLHIHTQSNSSDARGIVFQNSNVYYPLRSFGINFSYSFGKLKFDASSKINNDDVKGSAQPGSTGGGTGSPVGGSGQE